jgi:hypothetical protein
MKREANTRRAVRWAWKYRAAFRAMRAMCAGAAAAAQRPTALQLSDMEDQRDAERDRAEAAEERLRAAREALRRAMEIVNNVSDCAYREDYAEVRELARAALAASAPADEYRETRCEECGHYDAHALTCSRAAATQAEPAPRCPVCDGYGYIDGGHSGPDPVAEPCPHPIHDAPAPSTAAPREDDHE